MTTFDQRNQQVDSQINIAIDTGAPRPPIPLFLSPDEFLSRESRGILSGHNLEVVGRDEDLSRLRAWLESEVPVMVLHGPGGAGKTRLVLEFALSLIAEGSPWTPVFVRTGAEEFEPHLTELKPGQRYLVIVDDAHRFEHGKRLSELLANPSFGPVKLLLLTRPIFKDQVATFATGRYAVQEQALGPLKRADLDRLIRGTPFKLHDPTVRRAVLDLAEGSPLIAQAAAALAARGEDVRGLGADDVLKRYFDEMITEVLGSDTPRGRDFLAILAGIGGIDLGSPELRAAVRDKLQLSGSDQKRILSKLTQSGIVRLGYSKLRIVPDLLADHLLRRWLLDPATATYDFRTFILEPFFALKAPDILRNLAEAEFTGESITAGSLLSEVLDEFGREVRQANSAVQFKVLVSIRDFGVLRPDEAIYIVTGVDGPDQPESALEDPHLGRTTLHRWQVMDQAVEVLNQTKWVRVRDSLASLYKLSRWPGEGSGGDHVRKEAVRSIKELLELTPRVRRAVYHEGLDQVERWVRTEPESWPLCVELLKGLLNVEARWVEPSPANRNQVTLSQGLLPPTEALRSLRDRAFAMLRELYERTQSAIVRKRTIDAHEVLVVYHPRRPDPKLQAFLNRDIRDSIAFFNERLDRGAELYERFAIWDWAKGVQRHGGYRRKDLRLLIERLEADPMHEWYLNLAKYPEHYDAGDDWQAARQKQLAFIQGVIDQADETTIEFLSERLNQIADSAHRSEEAPNDEPIGRLLRQLGIVKPQLAERLLRGAAADRLELRSLAGAGLAGVRAADPDAAFALAREWASGPDLVLRRAVVHSYWRDESTPSDRDLDLIGELASDSDPALAASIVRDLPRFQQLDNARVIELLKKIASRAPDGVLMRVADVIGFQNGLGDGDLHILEIPASDLREIVWNFLRLPRVDGYDLDLALHRLGQADPLALLQFMRARIERAAVADDPDYRPLPVEFHYAFTGLEESEQYPELLREVRGWMKEAGGKLTLLTLKGAEIIKQLSGGRINDTLATLLQEWIHGTAEEQRAAAHILREFGGQDRFYELAKQLLDSNDDEIVQGRLCGASFSTPGAIAGPLIPFFQQRLQEYQSWLDDQQTPLKARMFARRMVAMAKASIDQEERREAEEVN